MITRSSWILAGGKIDLVPKENVLRHVALVGKNVVFEYDDHFKARTGFILDSLVLLSRQTKSTWKVRHAVGPATGERGYEIVKLLGSDGATNLRNWVLGHRSIVTTLGSKVWSLTEPLF